MKSGLLKILLLFLILIPIVLAANVDLDKLDAVKFTIREGDEKTLQFNDVEYRVKADSVSDNEARLTFLPVNYAAAVGKDQKADIDIDDDSEIDFSLTFVSSADKTVSLEARRIGAKKVKAVEEKEGRKQTLPDATAISNALRQNFKYILGAVVVLVVIILIVVVSRRKGNPEKFYRRAEGLHREAQEFHDDGDEETASELYERAEELREKARGLEKGEV